MLVIENQPHGPLAHFGGKLVRRLAHDAPPSQELEPPANPGRFSAGGAVHLHAGNSTVVVTEGIETALAYLRLRSACFERSGVDMDLWAALSTSGLKSLRLPRKPGRLIIACDSDPPGKEAANALAERADRIGWKVALDCPKSGDWNDTLLAMETN